MKQANQTVSDTTIATPAPHNRTRAARGYAVPLGHARALKRADADFTIGKIGKDLHSSVRLSGDEKLVLRKLWIACKEPLFVPPHVRVV
jgi:hypothetical protein